jgi:hypothetical protein
VEEESYSYRSRDYLESNEDALIEFGAAMAHFIRESIYFLVLGLFFNLVIH